MDKDTLISFFDQVAPEWDDRMVADDRKIEFILDRAGICPEQTVLDVACGTGVLFPYYLRRKVRRITGVDISPEMARIAAAKADDPRIEVICGDIEMLPVTEPYDCCVIYNAFPHFPDPDRLIAHLSSLLKPGGRLTLAHGMSRAMIDRHHEGSASRVSLGLMHEDALAAIFARHLTVTVKCSNDRMYQVVGVKE